MRVLFTTDYLDPDNIGGCGRVITELVARLSNMGAEVTVLAGLNRGTDPYRQVGSQRVRWQTFAYETSGSRGIGYYFRTRRAVRDAFAALGQEYDVIVHNQPLTAAAIGKLSSPTVYLFHSPWPLEYLADRFGTERMEEARDHGPRVRLDVSLRRHVESRAVGRADQVVTLSKTMSRHAQRIHGVSPERIRVIPGGVDLDRFTPASEKERSRLRQRWDSDGQRFVVSCVRRLVPRTGVDFILEALARADRALDNVRVLIAGKGPDRDALQKRVQRAGLSERVSFLGYIPDEELPDLYRASDLSLVPTRALEGFGLSTLEALACGTPVAATPVGGSVEILRPLHEALLAPDITGGGVRQVLKHWCTHPQELARLRQRTRRYVESHYSWDTMATELSQVLEGTAVLA